MTEREQRLAAKPAPQTAEDTIALLTASLVLVRLSAYKTCTCCERVFRTAADFETLPPCGSGYQPLYDENGDVRTDKRMELRNCDCRSTISVEVPCLPDACPECGSDTALHAFTCERRPCTSCDEERCVCGPDAMEVES